MSVQPFRINIPTGNAGRHQREVGTNTLARPGQHIEMPAGVALFKDGPKNLPRQYAERSLRIRHWAEMPRGGHFAAWEEPELYVEDLRAFLRPLRKSI
jgi:hypothetical protein